MESSASCQEKHLPQESQYIEKQKLLKVKGSRVIVRGLKTSLNNNIFSIGELS